VEMNEASNFSALCFGIALLTKNPSLEASSREETRRKVGEKEAGDPLY
jgi:hypothetical protein